MIQIRIRCQVRLDELHSSQPKDAATLKDSNRAAHLMPARDKLPATGRTQLTIGSHDQYVHRPPPCRFVRPLRG